MGRSGRGGGRRELRQRLGAGNRVLPELPPQPMPISSRVDEPRHRGYLPGDIAIVAAFESTAEGRPPSHRGDLLAPQLYEAVRRGCPRRAVVRMGRHGRRAPTWPIYPTTRRFFPPPSRRPRWKRVLGFRCGDPGQYCRRSEARPVFTRGVPRTGVSPVTHPRVHRLRRRGRPLPEGGIPLGETTSSHSWGRHRSTRVGRLSGPGDPPRGRTAETPGTRTS